MPDAGVGDGEAHVRARRDAQRLRDAALGVELDVAVAISEVGRRRASRRAR